MSRKCLDKTSLSMFCTVTPIGVGYVRLFMKQGSVPSIRKAFFS